MSVNSKMTAIADEIRTLSGTSGTMGLDDMATQLGNTNDEVDTQISLISQIQTALRGKAAATENLDSVLTEQESLIAELQEILGRKAAGGCTYETWTITYVDGTIEEKEVAVL